MPLDGVQQAETLGNGSSLGLEIDGFARAAPGHSARGEVAVGALRLEGRVTAAEELDRSLEFRLSASPEIPECGADLIQRVDLQRYVEFFGDRQRLARAVECLLEAPL